MPRRRVFCWLPTPIHTRRWHQRGFYWLRFAWLDADGCAYITKE